MLMYSSIAFIQQIFIEQLLRPRTCVTAVSTRVRDTGMAAALMELAI